MAYTTEGAVHRPLGFGEAVVRQLRLLWESRRPLLLGVALLALLGLAGEPWTTDPKMRLLKFWPLWLAVVGPVWAFAVFHHEGPSNRLYHWSMPVDRAQHTLARLVAGLVWLWVVCAVLIGVGIAMAAFDGNLWQLDSITAAAWVNFFTGPLLGYLAVSVLTVASDYPVRWFFGLLFVFPLTLSILDEWLGLGELVGVVLKPLASSEWGLFPTMIAGLGSAVGALNDRLRAMADPTYVSKGNFVMDDWWLVTPLWALLIGGIVFFLASRHPDTLPRLRRPD